MKNPNVMKGPHMKWLVKDLKHEFSKLIDSKLGSNNDQNLCKQFKNMGIENQNCTGKFLKENMMKKAMWCKEQKKNGNMSEELMKKKAIWFEEQMKNGNMSEELMKKKEMWFEEQMKKGNCTEDKMKKGKWSEEQMKTFKA